MTEFGCLLHAMLQMARDAFHLSILFSCAAPKSGERKGAAKEASKQEAPKGLFNFGGSDCLDSTLPFVTSCDQDLTKENPLNERKMQRQRLACHVLKPANMHLSKGICSSQWQV